MARGYMDKLTPEIACRLAVKFLNMSRFLPLFLLGFVWSSCSQENSMESFYYPINGLEEGIVYAYTGTDELDPPFYWYFRHVEQEGATFLTGMYYDANYTPYQFVREERVANGILLADYLIYETDSAGKQVQAEVEVLSGNVFSFEQPDPNQVLFSQVKYRLPSRPGETTTLTRNRQYLRDTTYTWKGEERPARIYYLRELIEVDSGGFVEHQFDGWEIYARDLGLVHYRKNVNENFVLEYRLQDTFSMQELERRAQQIRAE